MQLGIFAKTFNRQSVHECLAAVADARIPAVQFNLSVLDLDTVPEHVPAAAITATLEAAAATGVKLAAISGTFNAAHPDPDYRAEYIRRFPALVRAAADLNIPIITLSSGSRDADDMWKFHPDNATEAAWQASRETLTQVANIAEGAGIQVAFEPEHTNVVATAQLGRRMLDQVGSAALKVVFDAANLLNPEQATERSIAFTILEALDLLGPDIVLAHAKELISGRAPVPAGTGLLPWPFIVSGLREVGFNGTLVTHGLNESDVEVAVTTLDAALSESAPA